MSDEIYALDIRDETDVFTARHSAREVAAAVGVGEQDRSGWPPRSARSAGTCSAPAAATSASR